MSLYYYSSPSQELLDKMTSESINYIRINGGKLARNKLIDYLKKAFREEYKISYINHIKDNIVNNNYGVFYKNDFYIYSNQIIDRQIDNSINNSINNSTWRPNIASIHFWSTLIWSDTLGKTNYGTIS